MMLSLSNDNRLTSVIMKDDDINKIPVSRTASGVYYLNSVAEIELFERWGKSSELSEKLRR